MTQFIANGIFAASIYALVGTGFALIYRTCHFFHFAHGVICTLGAYCAYFASRQIGLPFAVAIVCSLVFSCLVGVFIEVFIYRRLRATGASAEMLLLASLGVYIVGQNIISMIFGDETRVLQSSGLSAGINFAGIWMTRTQVAVVILSIIILIALSALLKMTKMGLLLRAVANDLELARVCGIDVDQVMIAAFALGSLLAGLAGILVGLDINMVPAMGMRMLFMAVVAVIVGGKESFVGVSLGAILIGLVQHLGVWKLSTRWQDTIVFAVLIIFLLVRPQGFLGRPLRRRTI
jgi:branched-chain amino acid transport system permease protein